MITLLIRKICRQQSGATAIEYAFLAALIGVGLLGTFVLTGDAVLGFFTDLPDAFPDNGEGGE